MKLDSRRVRVCRGGEGGRVDVAVLVGLLAGTKVCPILQVFTAKPQSDNTNGAANELPKLLAPAQVTMAFKFTAVGQGCGTFPCQHYHPFPSYSPATPLAPSSVRLIG